MSLDVAVSDFELALPETLSRFVIPTHAVHTGDLLTCRPHWRFADMLSTLANSRQAVYDGGV